MSRFGWPNVLPVGFSSAVRHALRVALAIVILLGLADPWSVARASPPGKAGGPGETLFQAKCVACHTIGKGKLVGPDLKDVTTAGTRSGSRASSPTPTSSSRNRSHRATAPR